MNIKILSLQVLAMVNVNCVYILAKLYNYFMLNIEDC